MSRIQWPPVEVAKNAAHKFVQQAATALVHERGIAKYLLPACSDIFPSREPIPVGMYADCAGIGGPDLVHQVDIKAFECEIEFEVRLYDLFGIGHKESSFITSIDSDATRNIDHNSFGLTPAVPDGKRGGGCGITTFVKFRRSRRGDPEAAGQHRVFFSLPTGAVLTFDHI